jgi:hypothetical protein
LIKFSIIQIIILFFLFILIFLFELVLLYQKSYKYLQKIFLNREFQKLIIYSKIHCWFNFNLILNLKLYFGPNIYYIGHSMMGSRYENSFFSRNNYYFFLYYLNQKDQNFYSNTLLPKNWLFFFILIPFHFTLIFFLLFF